MCGNCGRPGGKKKPRECWGGVGKKKTGTFENKNVKKTVTQGTRELGKTKKIKKTPFGGKNRCSVVEKKKIEGGGTGG